MNKPQTNSTGTDSSEKVEAKDDVASSVPKASRDTMDLGVTSGQSPGVKVHLVKAPEMARILNVPLSAIYEHTRKGTIPHVRFGKYCRFDPVEVIAYFRVAIANKPGKQPQQAGACGIIAPPFPVPGRQPDLKQHDCKGNHDGAR